MGKYFTYSLYEKNLQKGEMWIRNPAGRIQSANEALKHVIQKYAPTEDPNSPYYDLNEIDSEKTRTFYSTITGGSEVLRFDVMHDVLFLETNAGCVFEQITTENGIIKPLNQNNNFIPDRPGFPDYWYDEKNKIIYIVSGEVSSYATELSGAEITYSIETYDISASILDTKYKFTIHFNFGQPDIYKEIPISEPCKITYNKDTKMFNISHIFRGPKKQFGLISINVFKDQQLSVKAINCFLPFQRAIDANYNILLQKSLSISSDQY